MTGSKQNGIFAYFLLFVKLKKSAWNSRSHTSDHFVASFSENPFPPQTEHLSVKPSPRDHVVLPSAYSKTAPLDPFLSLLQLDYSAKTPCRIAQHVDIALHELAGTFAFTEFGQLVREIFGEPKPERIDMQDYEESGDGYTAISYNHKNGKTMMKLYAPFVPISEPHRELEVAWNLADKGINIPHAHRLVTDGTRIGVEFERISPKKSFARAISQEPETLRRYAEEFARECKKLHAIPCDTKLFSPTENRFRAAITKLKEYSDEEKAKISAFIDSVPKATTCIHGDMHIGNIITNGEKNYWIDLSAFSYGNPLYDVGMLYFVSHTGDDELAQKLFHISAAQMLEVWTYFVPEYFGKEEPLASIEDGKPACGNVRTRETFHPGKILTGDLPHACCSCRKLRPASAGYVHYRGIPREARDVRETAHGRARDS